MSKEKPRIVLTHRAINLGTEAKVPKAFSHPRIEAAISGSFGRDTRVAQKIIKEGGSHKREVERLAARLREKDRVPEDWKSVVERIASFEDDFKRDIETLVATLKTHEFDEASGVEQEKIDDLIMALQGTRNLASDAFNDRAFFAQTEARPIARANRRLIRPPLGKYRKFGGKYKDVAMGLDYAKDLHERALGAIPDKPEGYDDLQKNHEHDSVMRDRVGATLDALTARLKEYLRAGDHLPKDAGIIERMKRELELVRSAIGHFDDFERELEAIETMEEYAALADLFPDEAKKRFDTKVRGRHQGEYARVYQDDPEDPKFEILVPNPKRIVAEHEKDELVAEAEKLKQRLVRLAEAYETALAACENLKV